jgi:oligopeptide transport system substrate-binding protein
MLQARFLGQYKIYLEGQLVIIPSRPTQSILAFLLLHPNVSHRREKLAGQFWPDSTEFNARGNLRHALWRIRKAIGSDANTRIESDDLGVTYHPQTGDQLDVELFEMCAESDSSIEGLIRAVSTYGGELLPGFYEEWVVLERERLQAAFERKAGKLLDRLLAERRWYDVLEWGEFWIALGGIPEPAYRALMLAHARLGNLTAAVAQYQRCVDVLAKELGVKPSKRTHEVFEQIRYGEVEITLPESTPPGPIIPTQPAYLEKPQKATPVFVGREAEMTALSKYLEQALKGHIQVVFVNGEAGSGKSTLLQEFMHRSMSVYPNLAVGWGICNAFYGQGVPYLPFRDVLYMLAGGTESIYTNGTRFQNQASHLSASSQLVIRTLVEKGPSLVNSFLTGSTVANRITMILPDEQVWGQHIEEPTTQESVFAGNQEKSQLFEQYTEVLRNIADQYPLLILLDDLQWMDPGTGRLFFHLVRRLRNSCILVAGAYRAEEVSSGRDGDRHPLVPLLNEFQSSFGEISIDLDRNREIYGRTFVNVFLDTERNQLDESFRQELYRRTHGNPLFTIQLLRNLQERGEIIPNEQGSWVASTHLNWDNLSPQVEGIIGERIGRLNRELQDLLLAASVEGEYFTVQVLERVHGTAERVILRQLSRELEKRHRLVQEMGEVCVGSRRLVRFRFVHALVQQYLYRQLGAAERVTLHREVAETLEMLYKEDIAIITVPLARHYREAGIKEEAVKYLLQAGDQARGLYAHQAAVDHYQQALAFLKEMGATEQTARTLMKLYLVYHNSFDFHRAQQTLEAYSALWQQSTRRASKKIVPLVNTPYRIPTLKVTTFDPGLCETIFDLELLKELFCGLVELSEDRNVIPLAARQWDVLDGGRRYVFHLRQDLLWSDGVQVTAGDFEFAWKRVLNPTIHSPSANLLYDVLGAKVFHQGKVVSSDAVGVTSPDPYTLVVELEEPCGHFPYILGDPISFAVPKHVVKCEGNAWAEPGRIVSNGAFQLESWSRPSGKTAYFTRNPHYFGSYKGNIEHVALTFYENELEMYQSFVSGELDIAEFLLPQLQQEEWIHYREVGQLHISTLPFVDAIYFIVDRPPFDNPVLRRAFALATDREKLAHEIESKLPATGGYIPPSLPGYSPDVGLPYDPEEARRILAAAGYPEGRDFPPVNLLIELVGLEKGDNLVFSFLQEMWQENLGVTIQKRRQNHIASQFDIPQDSHFFFTGWFADYPDPASFLQTNYLIDQSHWQNPIFERLIEEGRHTMDQIKRVDLYRQADRVLTEEAVVLPLFYGHIYELRQPWVIKPSGSSIYSPQWKDIILMPH